MMRPARRSLFTRCAALAHRSLLALALTLAAGSRLVAAQSPDQAMPAGTRVYVTLGASNTPLEGSLLTLSADSVALLVNGQTRTVPLNLVSRIDKDGDPVSDGAAKGALVVGLWCVLVCGQGVSGGNQFAWVLLANATIGGVIGWQFDRDHVGRSRVYPVQRDWRDARFGR